MIRTAELIGWLAEQVPALTVHRDPVPPLPEGPDRLVVITRTAGLPEINDGLFERPGFVIATRGAPGVPASAEDDLLTIDAAIRAATFPGLIGDTWVLSMTRRAGLSPGATDLGERAMWSGLWIVTGSTDL